MLRERRHVQDTSLQMISGGRLSAASSGEDARASLAQPSISQIIIDGVGKTYHGASGSHVALKSVSLTIERGEFFTLLGPSGCGKTSLLRMIAGFEPITSGRVLINGQDVSHLPPEKRSINTVFQHYALFPHMTVAQNVAFGLRQLRRPTSDIRQRTEEMLALVQMERFAHDRPGKLSGGQQQRVALARALAPRPDVILLDEPLSALDLKLRQAMRFELKRLQRETGITFVFVTHDQEEALAMSDRIAVLAEGAVQQTGTPTMIYDRPANRFVATFIGDSNLLPAEVVEETVDGDVMCRTLGGFTFSASGETAPAIGSAVTVSLRPEHVAILPWQMGDRTAEIKEVIFMGEKSVFIVECGGQILRLCAMGDAAGRPGLEAGRRVTLEIPPLAARIVAD